MGKLPIHGDSKVFNTECDNLIALILADNYLNSSSKLMLAGTIEVLRNSTAYWEDAKINPTNPYFNHLRNNNVVATNNISWPTYEQMVDAVAYADFYDYYSQGGYNPTQASNAAWQDAAYNSALAVQP